MRIVLTSLKPWLNMELYQAETKASNTAAPSSTYVESLRARGATEEELKDAVDLRSHLLRKDEGPADEDTPGDIDPPVIVSTEGK